MPLEQSRDDRTSNVRIVVTDPGGETIELQNLESFSYSSDVMQVGDPFSVVVPDPRGRYAGKLREGASVKFTMSNPDVNGGATVDKVRKGIIVEREQSSDLGRGNVIHLKGADIGWHLVHNDAPLWMNLRGVRFQKLLEACIFPHRIFKGEQDPGWGFEGIRADNDTNRSLKNGRAEVRIQQAPDVIQRILRIQVEPGEKIADVLIQYARREGVLVNVSSDGYLQLFVPNYSQEPLHRLEYHSVDSPAASRSNVKRARVRRSIETVWTDVILVWEQAVLDVIDETQSATNPNVGKHRVRVKNPGKLPFLHRAVISDSEPLSSGHGQIRANWKYLRGLFDAFTATYVVRGHHQAGRWWESDTMVEVNDTVNGVVGRHYVVAVNCSRDMQGGDVTEVTVKQPDLLGA